MGYLTLDKQIWLQLNCELRLNNPVFKLWTVNKYILKKGHVFVQYIKTNQNWFSYFLNRWLTWLKCLISKVSFSCFSGFLCFRPVLSPFSHQPEPSCHWTNGNATTQVKRGLSSIFTLQYIISGWSVWLSVGKLCKDLWFVGFWLLISSFHKQIFQH